jgi:hypothetical protein
MPILKYNKKINLLRINKMKKIVCIMILAVTIFFVLFSVSSALTINFLAQTGQTATADFSFINATQLQIILTETTPTATFTGDAAGGILTGIGFLLPGTTEIVPAGSTVFINTGSSSAGFSLGDLGAGATRLVGGTQ